jgi:hypothetical protein
MWQTAVVAIWLSWARREGRNFVAIAARRFDRDDRDGNAVAHYTARASRPLAS